MSILCMVMKNNDIASNGNAKGPSFNYIRVKGWVGGSVVSEPRLGSARFWLELLAKKLGSARLGSLNIPKSSF